MLAQLRRFVARHTMFAPGDRVAVAVSGGADSVCLLRLLLALRQEVGLVLSVAHFDHRLRAESADDAGFVQELAQAYDCWFHHEAGDTRARAREAGESIETAARNLRYAFFDGLLQSGAADKIATAHTLNDQAETVVMKILRGAGVRGMGGIHPVQRRECGSLVRPLLFASRAEIEVHLRCVGQDWRDDLTNASLVHLRNRVRHTLMPLLREFNPEIDVALTRTAEIMQSEEELLEEETRRALPFVLMPGEPVRGGGRAAGTHTRAALALSLEALARYPLALQRRLVRAAVREFTSLSLEETDRMLALSGVLVGSEASKIGKWTELAGGLQVRRLHRELQVQWVDQTAPVEATRPDEQTLHFTGEPLTVSYSGQELRLSLAPPRGSALSEAFVLELPATLTLRAWQPGDRYHAPHTRAPKKVKEHLQALKLAPEERALWPLLASGDEILWVRGLPPRRVLARGQQLLVEHLSSGC